MGRALCAVLLMVGCVSGSGDDVPARPVDASVPDTAKGDALIFEVDDPANCGSCTVDKPACVAGSCLCPGTTCGTECVELAADPRHCSACGNACGAQQYCRIGAGPACKCRPPAVACLGVCKDRNSDPTACGECDVVCPIACARGACVSVCPAGLGACPSSGKTACVDLQKDPSNCGSCGRTCAFDEICTAGSCPRYRPAVGCTACPCPVCATSLPGSTCCPGLPGHTSPICVASPSCP